MAIEELFSKDSIESEKADLMKRALCSVFMSVTDNVQEKIAGAKSAWARGIN